MIRLIAASVVRKGSEVALGWEVDGSLETKTGWLLSTLLDGGEDAVAHRFEVRCEDGRITAGFSDETTSVFYSTPQVRPQRNGRSWTASFPVSDVVTRIGNWEAVLSFDGFSDNANESSISGNIRD